METTLNSQSPTKTQLRAGSRSILAGILTGQIAGLIMAVVVMIVFALFLGKSPIYPVQVIGSLIFGEPALQKFHFGALIAGLLLHQLGPSLLWGAIYGLLAKKLSPHNSKSALAIGVGIGIISMVGPYVLIPAAMKTMQGVDLWNREVPLFWDWAAHIVFGASFTFYPFIENKLKCVRPF